VNVTVPDDTRTSCAPVFGARQPLLALDNAACTPHPGYVERRMR